MSIYDQISNNLSPIIRKANDVKLNFVGTKTQVLRISKSSTESFAGRNFDVFGGYDNINLESSANSTALSDVIVTINYPFGETELFSSKSADNTSTTDAIDILDFLPIELHVQLSGNYDVDPIVIEEGDLIIDAKIDENKNLIPIIMEVTRAKGSFFGKNLIKKTFEMSLNVSTFEVDVQNKINEYIDSLEII